MIDIIYTFIVRSSEELRIKISRIKESYNSCKAALSAERNP